MTRYVVEYDENGCVWLVDEGTRARIALWHGMRLDVEDITAPAYAVLAEEQPHG